MHVLPYSFRAVAWGYVSLARFYWKMRSISSRFLSIFALRSWGLHEFACFALLKTHFPWRDSRWFVWLFQGHFCLYWHSLLTIRFWQRGLWSFRLVLPWPFRFLSFRRHIASVAHPSQPLYSAELPTNFCGQLQTVPLRNDALSLVHCISLSLL